MRKRNTRRGLLGAVAAMIAMVLFAPFAMADSGFISTGVTGFNSSWLITSFKSTQYSPDITNGKIDFRSAGPYLTTSTTVVLRFRFRNSAGTTICSWDDHVTIGQAKNGYIGEHTCGSNYVTSFQAGVDVNNDGSANKVLTLGVDF